MLMDRGSTNLLRVHGPLIMESLTNLFADTKRIKICTDYCTFENIAKCDPTTTNVTRKVIYQELAISAASIFN